MKKLKLLVSTLLVTLLTSNLAAQLQQIKIVSFTVKNQLPGIIDSWISTPATLIMVAQKVPGPVPMREPRLVVQIRSGGALVCGNTPATARPVDPFDVRTFNTADLTGALINCHELKEGNYSICVQFFNTDKVAISQEVCKDFKVEDAAVEYSPPTLITPDNGKKFTAQELQSVVMFRWTPLVPKPKESVTYRLRVWQLMQGQNGIQAMRSNQPIVTKEVDNITQATVSGIYTGPCKPPYLCDFIWNVQAINHAGKPMGNNNGTSEPYTFSATEENSKGPDNVFPEDQKKFSPNNMASPVLFRWTAIVPKPAEPVTYRLKVWQLMEGQNGTQAMRTNKPIVEKELSNITETGVSAFYTGPCKPPYLCDFIWSVEASTRNAGQPEKTIGTSSPTIFHVTDENSKGPDNVFPEDKKSFNPGEVKQAVLFRWTPVVPKPQEPVTYRLKVWQLMEGQSGTQAMRTNQPIVTKDVDNITEATVSNIYTGPCKPPYLCDFIWSVEASTRQAGAAPKIIGTSTATVFGVTDENSKGPDNLFPEDKKKFTIADVKKEIAFRWTPIVPKPQEPVTYRLKVWQLMEGQSGTQAMRTNQPIVTKDVDNITEASVSGIYTGPCKPPYLCDFIWRVEASTRQAGATPKIIGTSTATVFGVTDENSKGPDNVFPEDKKKFSIADVKKEITFRWTPIVPKPQEPVTYRLKVWQLMDGQSGTQAMRTNKPIVAKDVADITEATVSGIYTGPCKPPYLCDFIWTVEASTRQAGATPKIVGTSEPTVFKIASNDIDIQIDSLHVSCCNPNGTQAVYIKIKNNLANTVKITNLNIDKVNGVTNVISIIGLAPALPVNITGNGFQVFTGTIKCIDTAKTIRFFVRAEDALDNAITETEVETDTLGCPCDPCRYMTIKVEKDSLSLPKNGNPTQVNLVGTFSNLDPNQVKKITAEIIYFNITQTKDTNCAKCVFDSKNYGNFYPPGSALPGYTGPVFNKPDYSRLVTWNSTVIKDCGGLPHDNGGGVDNGGGINNGLIDKTGPVRIDNTPARVTGNRTNQPGVIPDNNNPIPAPQLPNFSLPIAVPEMNSLSCCGDVIKICIRYTYYDFCCHACEVIKCYEIKREK